MTQAQAQRQAEARRGACICVAYWTAEARQGDEEAIYLQADAEARLARIEAGTASDIDIDGALDWLDMADEVAIDMMMTAWDGAIADGSWDEEEMAESLQDQLDGYADMAGEEMTDEMAGLMGYDLDEGLTEDQWQAWTGIVEQACRQWLADR